MDTNNKIKWISLSLNIVLAGLLAAAWWWHGKNPVIKIVKTTETETVYVTKPATEGEYKNCYYSTLIIDGTIKDNWLAVTARDDCKTKTKSFKLSSQDVLKHTLIFSPVIGYGIKNNELLYGGEIQYLYRVLNNVSIGGGVEVLAGDSVVRSMSIKPSIAFHF